MTDSRLPTPAMVLFVLDVAGVARFYESVAQMTRLSGDADHVVLGTPGLELVIHGIPPHLAGPATVPPVKREDSYWKLCLPVPAISAARAAVQALGGQLNPPEREWSARGFRACDGMDPEGNVFQLREPDPQSGA